MDVGKARTPKTPAAPLAVDALVERALKLAASSDASQKWSAKSNAALFNEKEANWTAAASRCLNPEHPFLRQVKVGSATFGELTPAGLVEAIPSLDRDAAAKTVLATRRSLSTADRAALSQEIASRTSGTGGEVFTELLAAFAQDDERVAADAAARGRRAEAAMYAALLAAKQAQCARLDAELKAARADETRLVKLAEVPSGDAVAVPVPPPLERAPVPKATTPEELDFRRNVARRLVSSWLQQWRLGRDEARLAVETVIGGVTGLHRVGAVGDIVAFDGVSHECESAVSESAEVKIVRPGWELAEDDGPYTLSKALVE